MDDHTRVCGNSVESPGCPLFARISGVALAGILLTPAARAAEPAPPLLSLQEALSIAVENNRIVKSAALDVSKAEEKTAQAKSYRWPSLSLDIVESRLLTSIDFRFEKGAFGDFPGIGPVPAEDTKIGTPKGWTTLGIGQVQVPISQQYKIGLKVDLSKASGDYYREQHRGQRQTTVDEVRKTYYGILRADAARVSAEESLTFAREVERVVGDKVGQQKSLEVDSIEARARLARADADALTAKNALLLQKERLNYLLGRDLGIDFQAVAVPDPGPYPGDLAAARARALDLSPEARKARLQVEQARIDLKVSRADYLPDLGFVASYISPYSADFLPRNIYSVGFLFQWEIFDGGRRRHQIAEKRAQLEQALLSAAQTESATLLDVGDKYRGLEEGRRSLAAAELNRMAKRERLRISKDRYEQQVIVAEDLLRAQSEFADAERQYIGALAAYWTARADLERAVGEEP